MEENTQFYMISLIIARSIIIKVMIKVLSLSAESIVMINC